MSTISPEVRPARENASKASQLTIGPVNAGRSLPGHAQSADRLIIGDGTVLGPEKEEALLLLR